MKKRGYSRVAGDDDDEEKEGEVSDFGLLLHFGRSHHRKDMILHPTRSGR